MAFLSMDHKHIPQACPSMDPTSHLELRGTHLECIARLNARTPHASHPQNLGKVRYVALPLGRIETIPPTGRLGCLGIYLHIYLPTVDCVGRVGGHTLQVLSYRAITEFLPGGFRECAATV